MNTSVICQYCNKPVLSHDDLITTLRFYKVRPYHTSCWAKRLKEFEDIFIGNRPINGKVATIFAFLMPAFVLMWALGMLFLSLIIEEFPFSWLAAIPGVIIIGLPAPLVRLWSYYKYEKPLKDVSIEGKSAGPQNVKNIQNNK